MWRTIVRSLVLASPEGFCHTADCPGVCPRGHRRNPRSTPLSPIPESPATRSAEIVVITGADAGTDRDGALSGSIVETRVNEIEKSGLNASDARADAMAGSEMTSEGYAHLECEEFDQSISAALKEARLQYINCLSMDAKMRFQVPSIDTTLAKRQVLVCQRKMDELRAKVPSFIMDIFAKSAPGSGLTDKYKH